jgi:hypothetical protein
MAMNEPDVAEETGEQTEEIERTGGNIVTTSLSGLDMIIMVLVIVIVASMILTLFYGRQMLSQIGIGIVGSGVSPLTAFFNGIASAIAAAFARLVKWINPGAYGYAIMHLKLWLLTYP